MFHFCNYYHNKKKNKLLPCTRRKLRERENCCPNIPLRVGINKGLEIYCLKNGKHILLCLGCFLTNEPREGVRNGEPVKKYRVISPRNEPARTFSLMLFSCCNICALIVLLRRLQCRLSWLLLLLSCNCSSHTLKDVSFSLKILLLLSIKITSLPPAALSASFLLNDLSIYLCFCRVSLLPWLA